MLDFLGLQQIIAKKWEFMEFGDFVKSPGTTTLSEMSFYQLSIDIAFMKIEKSKIQTQNK